MRLFLSALRLLAAFFIAGLPFPVPAAEYQIDDIQLKGLQRVSPATVFAAISIRANSSISEEELQQAIRDLFATGFFEKVSADRDGNILRFDLAERPVVATIVIEGNKILDSEALLEGLKSVGLAEGEVFAQSALEIISRQLNSQYSALGRYSAGIETSTIMLENNQVYVEINIDEGEVAKIQYINIVGNRHFREKELRDLFTLNTTGTWSWLTGSDKYAREKLSGDIERLRSFYLNRGYLEFEVTSTQVSLSPDKESVFITVNIEEGSRFIVDSVDIAGDPILSEEELQQLILIQPGDVFSQFLVTRSGRAIENRLGNQGYSAAQVNGVPEIKPDRQAVALIFYINPGDINYVRRINFTGNTATADHVLRREMRQLEGAPISAQKLEQSRLRLERLGLFADVRLSTREVPGTNDQVDVEIAVTEQPTASINLSLGYSGANGVSLGAGLQHKNWLGTGNTFGFNVEISDIETDYSVSFLNPYFTRDGVSRGINLFYRKRDFEDVDISNYATDAVGMRVTFGYPISEISRVSLGLGVANIAVTPGLTASQEIKGSPDLRSGVEDAYVSYEYYQNVILPELGGFEDGDTNNNNILDELDALPSGADPDNLIIQTDNPDSFPTPTASGYQELVADDAVLRDNTQGFLDRYGDDFDTLTLDFGWSRSNYNRGIFPTDGSSQSVSLEVAVPGGDLEYYKIIYRGDWYFPLSGATAFRLRNRLGYADAYGDIDVLPFFENFFSGGIGSVRGFEPRSLGPKATPASAYFAVPAGIDRTAPINESDLQHVYVLGPDDQLLVGSNSDVDTLGGNILFEIGAEMVFPTPFVSNDKLRTVLFVDAGNVFSTDCGASQRNCGNLDLSKLSASAGISLQWLSPVGPLVFSFAAPIQEQPFDETETFQFSLGRSF